MLGCKQCSAHAILILKWCADELVYGKEFVCNTNSKRTEYHLLFEREKNFLTVLLQKLFFSASSGSA